MQNRQRKESIAQTENILLKVSLAGRRLRKSRKRFAAYQYLKAVYRAHERLAAQNILPLLPKAIKKQFGQKVSKATHPLRTLIDATSREPDSRVRSRWARALDYALSKGIPSDNLIPAIQQPKGIAGLATLAAIHRPKRMSKKVFLDYMDSLKPH